MRHFVEHHDGYGFYGVCNEITVPKNFVMASGAIQIKAQVISMAMVIKRNDLTVVVATTAAICDKWEARQEKVSQVSLTTDYMAKKPKKYMTAA